MTDQTVERLNIPRYELLSAGLVKTVSGSLCRWLDATRGCEALVADARREALEEACRLECRRCRDGEPVTDDEYFLHSPDSFPSMCRAVKIRRVLQDADTEGKR